MQSQVLNTWFDMGGYAGYVWPSYAIATLVLLTMLAVSYKEWRKARARFRELERQS